MRSRPTTLFASALALTVLVALPAHADRQTDWDLNKDGNISVDEFVTGWGDEGVFYRSDTDRDGRLSNTELNDPDFNTLDVNRDGVVTEDEFAGGTFNRYDVNRDGMLGRGEWQSFESAARSGGWLGTSAAPRSGTRSGLTLEQRRLKMSNLYSTWDTDLDRVLSKEEFERGVAETGLKPEGDLFGRYDVNNDQIIGLAEWGSFENDVETNGWIILAE